MLLLEFLELPAELALIGGDLPLRLREGHPSSAAATVTPRRTTSLDAMLEGRLVQIYGATAAPGDENLYQHVYDITVMHSDTYCWLRASAIAAACDMLSTVHSIVTVT